MKIVRVSSCAAALLLAGLGAVPAAAAATSAAGIRVTIVSPTHHPKVNVPWPVKVTVTSAASKPLAGTLTMLVLFGGAPVGKIDNGAVYHFVGSWQERAGNGITWPAASRGQPLTFEVVVKTQGKTIRKTWAIQVT